MRMFVCMCLAVAMCALSGCFYGLDENTKASHEQHLGENIKQSIVELQGPHYAKLNSIGCMQPSDIEIVDLATHRNDYDTIDHLIRDKRCFVIPTGVDMFIRERVKDDIVSVKLKGSTEIFYTERSNLVAE